MITELNYPKKSDIKIRNALIDFVKKEPTYKNNFLQSKYNIAFDGYSYIGQKDSLNQYETDMLHSFVISEFISIENYPKEFHSFLKEDWNDLLTTVKHIELDLVNSLNIPELHQLYKENSIGYMMSCNYYPKTKRLASVAKNNTRLSAHKDVSLFTTFPYGIDEGLTTLDNNNNANKVETKNTMFVFPGYLSEFVTNDKIKALQHQVDLPKNSNSERFSFAIFSIPKPNSTFSYKGNKIKSNDYYKQYLSLF